MTEPAHPDRVGDRMTLEAQAALEALDALREDPSNNQETP